MQTFPKTIILRHRKENLKKCSLSGLESRDDLHFLTYPKHQLPLLEGYILLTPDAEPLTSVDSQKGLFLIDGTWRYAEKMVQWVEGQVQLEKRSLPPSIITAYPRCQTVETGLASVEALYASYFLLGRDPSGLLEGYHWGEAFLAKNPQIQ